MSQPADLVAPDPTEDEIAARRKNLVDLCVARAMLGEWGRACKVRGDGYPSMSTTEKARIGRGGRNTGPDVPESAELIDAIVARAPREHRLILVESYTKRGSTRQHAARLGLSSGDYWRCRTRAEEYVRDRLQVLEQKV